MMVNFTPEQDQYLQLAQSRAYYQGLRDGIRHYAHWQDGVQYVGTTGRTLDEALANVDLAEHELVDQYKRLEIL